jgi:N,N'-diacetyllegionaminate synthase
MSERVYIIAEAGVNHNGSLDLAFQLCKKAKEAGADAVKFQTWVTDNIITKETSKADYQKHRCNHEESQYNMLKRLELSFDDFRAIKKYCDKIGITFLSTPDDEDSLDFLLSLGLETIKIGSGEINNIEYLRYVGSKKNDIILSTGMADLKGVELAYNTLITSGARSISLLHCTTNYPCPMNEVNLKAMITLRNHFKCRTGYSDHTIGIEIPIAATALGAKIIEKHFTLDKSLYGPDHKASIDTIELKQMVTCIRNVEQAFGDGIKKPNTSEILISNVVLKRLVAKRRIEKGDIFTKNNITKKRSGKGAYASEWDSYIGKKSDKAYNENEPIL